MVALLYLKHAFNESDEDVIQQVLNSVQLLLNGEPTL
jgi:hypothetical protein